MSKRLAVCIAALAVGMTACGGSSNSTNNPGDSGGTLYGACNLTGEFACVELRGPAGAGAAQGYQTACTNEGNTWLSSCPTANLVGTCTVGASGTGQATSAGSLKNFYYSYTGGPTAGTLQQACTASGGTWGTN